MGATDGLVGHGYQALDVAVNFGTDMRVTGIDASKGGYKLWTSADGETWEDWDGVGQVVATWARVRWDESGSDAVTARFIGYSAGHRLRRLDEAGAAAQVRIPVPTTPA